jgi:hypothetical protein
MRCDSEIVPLLTNLERYAKTNDYSGYDPYDALNSETLQSLNNKLLKLIFTQILVYSPVNLRNFLKIDPGKNPKAIGIFLQSYCKLFHHHLIEKKEFDSIEKEFVGFLLENRSPGYSGDCWGFNFNWQDLNRYSQKSVPTIVVTSYVANAFLDLYEITKNKKYLENARSSCDFILKDLHRTKTERGHCFSYTPIDTYVVHNANALGAALLARVYTFTKEDILLEYSKKAFDFLVSYQKNNGSWSYSMDIAENQERNQIDFHQGFILDSLCSFISSTNLKEEKYEKTIVKGSEFYLTKQFHSTGYSYWRLPVKWPVDIHNQAQGIITGCILFTFFNQMKYLDFSTTIVKWTSEHMLDPTGYFYYQKWPLFINKIPYMRWGQAWMLLALSTYLSTASMESQHGK